ncbi:SPOC like C-terminal domain-containing protein [Mrakia frigida]|uniref:ATP-dependent DNA helicase YKU70 n=1 Tax=Mrakia frigida TaxID=29902 RepID=UPI003FCC14D5
MPPLQKNDNWDDEEWEEDDLTDYNKSSKDAILICLDASASMQRPLKNDDDEEEEEEQEDQPYSYFQGALNCVFELQKRKALKNPSDLVGILIYNTARLPEHESQESDGMFTLAKLATVGIDQVKELKELLDAAQSDPSSLTEYLPPLDKAISTTYLLERIVMEFKEAGIKDGARRVFLITDDDNPGGRMDETKSLHQVTISTKNKMKDLSELGAAVIPFFLARPDTTFDTTKFWDTILSFQTITAGGELPDEAEPEVLRASDGLVAFENLLTDLQVKQMAKRALWTVPLMLTDDLVIGVKGYGMITETKKPSPKYYYTDQPEAEMAESSTNYFDARDEAAFPSAFGPEQLRLAFDFSGIGAAEPRAPRYENGNDDTGGEGPTSTKPMDVDDEATQDEIVNVVDSEDTDDEDVKPVLPSSVKQEQTIGPEGLKKPKITFTKAQLAKLRSVGLDPGIKIIGFQDSDSLKFEYNIKHSYFIYPDEATYTGSTRTFAALLRDLLNKDKIGIARCVYRKNSSPLMCAMLPQEETFTESGAQDKPPGFHLIPFPFMDDMREPPTKVKGEDVALLEADEDHVELMFKVIKKLKGGGYQPENFPNPVLARHYAHLEALAFDGAWNQTEAEKVEDKTAPLWESMHDRAGDRMERWNDSIRNDPMASSVVMKTKKATASSSAAKRKAEVDLDIDLEVVREKYKDGTLAKLTVPVLKSFLRSVSRLPPGAPKKADLIAAADTYLREDSA